MKIFWDYFFSAFINITEIFLEGLKGKMKFEKTFRD